MTLAKAYTTSMKVFEQVSVRRNPNLLEELKSIQPGEITVVQGTYDHIEKILDVLKVPYEMSGTLSAKDGTRVLLVNCKSYDGCHANEGMRHFVEEGGRLVTTDWALRVVTTNFPETLHKTAETNNDVVEIRCTGLGAKLIGMHYTQCHPKWWLEGSSHVYSASDAVLPLITSEELQEKYGQPYIAVGFPHGKGEVLHFISHIELQRTHQRTDADRKGLEEFLSKMEASKTEDMEWANVAELEAAYSSLNTLAHLCAKSPVLAGSTKSVLRR